jgi:hypothetical protein
VRFDAHGLFGRSVRVPRWPDCNTNNIYINMAQDLLISYCLTPQQAAAMHDRTANPLEWKRVRYRTGSINISDIFTGRCLAKIEKRKQLKYPFHLLTHAQQQSALVDYKRTYGKGRLRHVMNGGAAEAMVDVPPSTSTTAVGSDPAARAIELQQEERSLQMLLHINAQEQQQLHHAPPHAAHHPPPAAMPVSAAASAAPISLSAFHQEAASVLMDVDDDLDDDDDADDASLGASDHSSDEEREADAEEVREQQGQMSAARVLFPLQSATPSAPAVATHQLAPHELELPDLAAYRAYNRGVRQRNAALKDITAVCFNEDRNEIYTGNRAGKIHVWAH